MKFWNTVQINRKGPLIMLAYQTGFFAFGVAMVLGINTFLNKDMDYACMGSLMAAIGIAAPFRDTGHGPRSARGAGSPCQADEESALGAAGGGVG